MMQKMRMQLVSTTSCEQSVSVKFLQKLYESKDASETDERGRRHPWEQCACVCVGGHGVDRTTSELLRSVRTQLTNNL